MKDIVYREMAQAIQEYKAQITKDFEAIHIKICGHVYNIVPAHPHLIDQVEEDFKHRD